MLLVKTPQGHQVMKDRSVRLTPRQRSALILCDGKRSVSDLLDSGTGVTRDDLDQMLDAGLLVESGLPSLSISELRPDDVTPAGTIVNLVQPGAAALPADQRTAQQKYQDAYPIATRLTAGLGLRGFRLNLAVEASATVDDLRALAPKIKAAVGAERVAELERALDN